MVVSGVGPDYNFTTAHTLDATGTSGFRAIENYPEYTFDNPFARL